MPTRPPRLATLLFLGFAVGCSSSPSEGHGDTHADAGLVDAAPDTTREEDTPSARDAAAADTEEDAPSADAPIVEDVAPDVEPCRLGAQRCVSEAVNAYCERGLWVEERCPARFQCFDGEGCERVVCELGEPSGCAAQDALAVCDERGTGVEPVPCPEGLRCRYVVDRFQCTDTVCDAGQVRCQEDGPGLEVCGEEGLGWTPGERCGETEECDEGACRSLCEINSKVSSFLGCEYWSVDLDNIEGGQDAPHAVILSNPTAARASVEVFDALGRRVEVEGWPTEVAPGELAVWPFDPATTNRVTGEALLDGGRLDGSVIAREAFRFETDVPVTAHQFNPLVGDRVYTNDASLLLPGNAIGTEYVAMSWRHRFDPGRSLRGFVTVVAVAEEPTTVRIEPTATVVEGTDRHGSREMTRLYAGTRRSWVLERGEVLNLESAGPEGEDLTGTSIVADRAVAVFSGHECGNVQLGINRCDHIETQLAPVATWGTAHVATKFARRGMEPDIVRVLASVDGTRLRTTPSLEGVDGAELDRGAFLEFEVNEHTVVEATAPISVGHYMVGSNWETIPLVCNTNGWTGIGDPALTILPPTAQHRDNYIVLTPAGYTEDYVNVVALEGVTVELDGEAVAPERFTAVGETGYRVAVLAVEAGPHTLLGSAPFGLEVYGYGCHVSYAYPGGMNLEAIAP